jgi:undecaprenyl diphosphate synthase
VAIIMDGNGRWATRRGLPLLAGHRAGTRALRRTVEAAPDLGVRCLVVYAFSTENWGRPQDEVAGLMSLFADTIER